MDTLPITIPPVLNLVSAITVIAAPRTDDRFSRLVAVAMPQRRETLPAPNCRSGHRHAALKHLGKLSFTRSRSEIFVGAAAMRSMADGWARAVLRDCIPQFRPSTSRLLKKCWNASTMCQKSENSSRTGTQDPDFRPFWAELGTFFASGRAQNPFSAAC